MNQPTRRRLFREGYARGVKDFRAGVHREADPFTGQDESGREQSRGWQAVWVTRREDSIKRECRLRSWTRK